GPAWMPFQAHKLSVLTAAMIAPELISGVVSIALFGGGALLQLATFAPELRARLSVGEPWAMLAFAAFSLVVLANRLRRQSVELALAEARAESLVLRRIARRLLAVRDLANTPLQTLEANIALVTCVPGAELYADRMRRSLDRLREWQRILDEDTRAIGDAHELAFDPHQVLDETS